MQPDSSAGEVDAMAEGGTDGSAATGPTGQNGGCGCKTAQAKADDPSSALLAFGGIGLLGVVRVRRRKRK